MAPSERVIEFLIANRRALRFLTLFALIFAGCYLLFSISPGIRQGVIKPYTEFLARAVASVRRLASDRQT